MDRTGMVGIVGEHALERGHDGRALRVWLGSARLPIIPGAQIHNGFGVEHRNIVVVRKLGRDTRHGGGICSIELPAVLFWILRVTRRECRDQLLFAPARLWTKSTRLLGSSNGGP